MRTTLEIPDRLFREAKAAAAHNGESLKDLVTAALQSHLARKRRSRGKTGWRAVFGAASRKDVARIDKIIAEEFERIDPSEWD